MRPTTQVSGIGSLSLLFVIGTTVKPVLSKWPLKEKTKIGF